MPVNMVTGTKDWVPFGSTIRPVAEIGQPKIAHDFIKASAQMVADAINEVDGCQLTTKEVITVVNTFHPWSDNVPEGICIDLQPGAKDASWGMRSVAMPSAIASTRRSSSTSTATSASTTRRPST